MLRLSRYLSKSERSDNSKYNSRDFRSLQDRTIRRLIGYCDRAQDANISPILQCQYNVVCASNSISPLLTPMGLLPDKQNCVLCMHWECRERFPRHRLQRKWLISDPGMLHGTCVTHVPWCMSGSLTRRGGETLPAFPANTQPDILCIWQEAHEWYAKWFLCVDDVVLSLTWLLLYVVTWLPLF